MAEIPVEKESGSKAWLWLLLAAVAIALLTWWLLEGRAKDEAVDHDGAIVASVQPADAGTLTTGEPVNLSGVQVASVAGDRTFFIDHFGARVPVLLSTPAPSGSLDEGATVNLTGELRQTANGLPPGTDASALNGSQTYILATDVEPMS
ncbi:hypothetical protein [Altericroceibacterium xinjiangense]|uniref:hypothetical protein n=1 Tax=Altericroceibacterium xinjiangense TaxID=762261 RepID=UPI000F7EC454|nr:hypothetical protein [Altericroceibacterium xinjiangense]